jgi:hypothetical protein
MILTPQRRVTAARDMSIELKAWRAGMGYTEAGAADKLGVPMRLYQSWESGTPCAFPAMVEAAIGAPGGKVLFRQ